MQVLETDGFPKNAVKMQSKCSQNASTFIRDSRVHVNCYIIQRLYQTLNNGFENAEKWEMKGGN